MIAMALAERNRNFRNMGKSINPSHKPRMLTEREQLMLRLDLILYIRLLRLMRVNTPVNTT